MNSKHGGLRPNEARGRLDFSANINPAGAPDWLRDVISRHIEDLVHYPEPEAQRLLAEVERMDGISEGAVIAGNGASELLYAAANLFADRHAVIPVPSYDDYHDAARAAGMSIETLALNPENQFQPDFEIIAAATRRVQAAGRKMVLFLGIPNNPTGITPDRDALLQYIIEFPDVMILLDESFLDFVPGYSSFRQSEYPNLLVLRSLTKFFAIPGLRLGLLFGPPRLIAQIAGGIPCWNVNTLAQEVGIRALSDTSFRAHSLELLPDLRRDLSTILSPIPGITLFPGEANFFLCRFTASPSADQTADALKKAGIAVRRCGNFRGLSDQYLRFAVRPATELRRLRQAVDQLLSPRNLPESLPRRGAVLMIQGTASNAGKSLVTAALCRIFHRRGIRTAPFKAQNMALNSSVTREGGEIGRAQALQAAACGIDADVRMNPVLLKPSSDTSSQIIELGRPIGTYSARDYYTYKQQLWQSVTASLDSLRDEYELVIIEGAGSPGEVNLRAGDIVNMAVARYAEAPVLLVGDIDRGGLFASFVGTLEVLPQAERELIKGYLVNKFRGDPALLAGAYEYMLERTGLPVFGTLPYISDHGLPEEDSVSFKAELRREGREDAFKVGFIDLPHISNFTDLDPLKGLKGLELVPILPETRQEKIFACAALIIPGSKNVAWDLDYLDKTGLARLLLDYIKQSRGLVLGICGGLQMLGSRIEDPYNLESGGPGRRGLSVFPYITRLARDKQTRLREAFFPAEEEILQGYEIHHGKSEWGDLPVLLEDASGEILGVEHPESACWVTYLHGILENRIFLERFLAEAGKVAGLSPEEIPEAADYDLDRRLDQFADRIEKALDIEAIMRITGIGKI